jgi:hypothetical protein
MPQSIDPQIRNAVQDYFSPECWCGRRKISKEPFCRHCTGKMTVQQKNALLQFNSFNQPGYGHEYLTAVAHLRKLVRPVQYNQGVFGDREPLVRSGSRLFSAGGQ